MNSTGADVPAAIKSLRTAGYSVADIAGDLLLHRSTIYRWANATQRPSSANFEALVELVDQRHKQALAGRIYASAVHLAAAAEALVTVERTERREGIAQRLRTDFAAREECREAEQRERNANAARIRDEVLGQPNSVTYLIPDPFDVIDRHEPALPF